MFRIMLILLLVIHTAMTFYFLRNDGYFSVLPPFKEGYTWQIFSDLAVAMSLILFFIYRELKLRKESLISVYVLGLATLLLGSFAPLAFLLCRKDLFKSE